MSRFQRRSTGSRDGYRSQCKECHGYAPSKRQPAGRKRSGQNSLPVEPFRTWLSKTIPVYENLTAFCDLVGVPDRTIRRIMYENKTVQLSVVDHILIHEGSTMLWELYPDE